MKKEKKYNFSGFETTKLVHLNKIFGGYDHKRPGGIGGTGGGTAEGAGEALGGKIGG